MTFYLVFALVLAFQWECQVLFSEKWVHPQLCILFILCLPSYLPYKFRMPHITLFHIINVKTSKYKQKLFQFFEFFFFLIIVHIWYPTETAARDTIEEVMAEVLSKSGSNRSAVRAVCLGISGVNHLADQERILSWLRFAI